MIPGDLSLIRGALLLVTSATLLTTFSCAAQTISEYTFEDHPLLTLPEFSAFRSEPVVVRKFYYHRDNERLLNRMIFFPRSTTYLHFNTTNPFGEKLDAILTPGIVLQTGNRDRLLEVHLNRPARVFALLAGHGLGSKVLSGKISYSGVPSDWSQPTLVEAPQDRPLLGESERHNGSLFGTPPYAVAFEVPLPSSHIVTMPHPTTMSFNGLPFQVYVLLFAQPRTGLPLRAFGAPDVPATFLSLLGDEVSMPQLQRPVPNRSCPTWLHDVHVTRTRHGIDAISVREPLYWRTWHPPIDPIYWCYYDHEHGSNPGDYHPMFGYTSWKTPKKGDTGDESHQIESHAGFKVFSFLVPGDGRFVVATLHMHLALARRFYERHHTIIFAVLKAVGDVWETELEFHMKLDLGGAEATLSNGTTVPIDRESAEIIKSLEERGLRAGRRFNILNIDSGFPGSVDRAYFIKGDIRKGAVAISNGIYEQWKGPLNNCASSRGRLNQGFIFDVRDPTTAMRRAGGKPRDRDMQRLNGRSVNKILSLGNDGVQIGAEFCNFTTPIDGVSVSGSNVPDANGVFFTDPYFSTLVPRSGPRSLRQYMAPGFKMLDIPPGTVSPVDPWSGHMEYGKPGVRAGRFLPIEESVLAKDN